MPTAVTGSSRTDTSPHEVALADFQGFAGAKVAQQAQPPSNMAADNEAPLALDELQVDPTKLETFNNKRYLSKLEKLLAQPDIFNVLRKIEAGLIKNYDDLDINALEKHDKARREKEMRRANGIQDDANSSDDDDFQIYQMDSQP